MTRNTLLRISAGWIVCCTLCASAANKPEVSPEGTIFHFHSNLPKFINCDAELRDPSGERWPNFYYGRPTAGGNFTFGGARSKSGYTVVFDQMCQPKGDQSRKVLAELSSDSKFPTIGLQVASFGAIEQDPNAKAKGGLFAPVTATLAVGTRQVPMKGRATFRWLRDKGDGISGVLITTSFTVTGKDLGLSGMGARPVEIRITSCATTEASAPAPKPKKK